MSAFRYVLALLCLAPFSLAEASVTLNEHPSYPAPNYFSGTNARAFFNVSTVYPHYWIERVELYVGGELVYDRDYAQPSPIPSRNGANASVMFDSNRFANGSSVEVKFRAKVNGNWYEESYFAPAKNKAICLGMNDLEVTGWTDPYNVYHSPIPLSNSCKTHLQDIGWDAAARTDFWNYDAFNLEICQDRNIVIYNGHGTPGAIYSGEQVALNASNMLIGNPIYATWSFTETLDNVYQMRLDQIGNNMPPFNDTNRPPINFTYLICCDSGSADEFITFCWPYYDGYGNYLENQGILCFSDGLNPVNQPYLVNAAFTKLKAGWPLESARAAIIEEASQFGYVQTTPQNEEIPYDMQSVVIFRRSMDQR